jgi:hypothetical protein
MRVCSGSPGGAVGRSQGRQPLVKEISNNPTSSPEHATAATPGESRDGGGGVVIGFRGRGVAVSGPGADAPGYVLTPPSGARLALRNKL